MCCNAFSKTVVQHAQHQRAKAAAASGEPLHVEQDEVAAPVPDGYWVRALHFETTSEYPDLVGYGLGYAGKPATVRLFENPKNSGSSGWKVVEIQSLDYPVAMSSADLTGNGYNDIIITDRYGPSMDTLWDAETENGGRVSWLRNPGQRGDANPYWTLHPIGNSTGMHRVEVGHFTRSDVWQVMGFPVISKAGDLTSPTPVILYTPQYGVSPSDGPMGWTEENIFPSSFRLIHDVKLIKGGNNGLDMILVAGREGVVNLWFEFDHSGNFWNHCVLGTGLPRNPESGSPFWGSGSVDVAAVGDDPIGYINTCEAFHGNVISVYIKKANAPKGPRSLKSASYWERKVIDNYGPLSSEHVGTIHNVTTIETGAANQSFGAACMGAPIGNPNNQGVYMYTPVDLAAGVFTKSTVTGDSASRLAVDTFNDLERKDIASITYYVPNYHTGPDPPTVRINTLLAYAPITATKLDKEVLVRLPRPTSLPTSAAPSLPMMTFAGKKLSILVLPPSAVFHFNQSSDAIKVIYGTVEMTYQNRTVVRGVAPPAHAADTTAILSSDGCVKAGSGGAVVLRVEVLSDHVQGPFRVMSDVAVANVFPVDTNVDPEVRRMNFPFNKVDTLAWAQSGLWNDFEFYNMTGVHFFFNDDSMEEICHMQAWTLGLCETARFHNHSDKSFCEIHYCLSNGGGSGGMRYFPNDYPETPEAQKHIEENELYKTFVEENSTLLVVPSMFEHGPLWKIVPGTLATPKIRKNDTVDYPWHAWLASNFGARELPIVPPLPANEQAYDVWLAFEFPPTAFQF
jgi:aldos-2-ulose dehydratase